MVAVDTNVVVRLVTNDDAAQAAAAQALFRAGPVFVAKSVLLETAWVLRYSYRLSAAVIVNALRALLGLPNVGVEDPTAIVAALAMVERGLDFADALHLASSTSSDRFATFDLGLVKRSRDIPGIDVVAVGTRDR